MHWKSKRITIKLPIFLHKTLFSLKLNILMEISKVVLADPREKTLGMDFAELHTMTGLCSKES